MCGQHVQREVNMRRGAISCCIIVFALGMLTPNNIHARTWQVPNDVPTIKQAVEDSATYGDTVLVAPGVYDTNSGEIFPINMTSGIILTSESGAPQTTIDANTTGSVILCISCDGSTEISGFTITGGHAQSGGGIYCDQSYVTIRDNVIRNNTATHTKRNLPKFQFSNDIDNGLN